MKALVQNGGVLEELADDILGHSSDQLAGHPVGLTTTNAPAGKFRFVIKASGSVTSVRRNAAGGVITVFKRNYQRSITKNNDGTLTTTVAIIPDAGISNILYAASGSLTPLAK